MNKFGYKGWKSEDRSQKSKAPRLPVSPSPAPFFYHRVISLNVSFF